MTDARKERIAMNEAMFRNANERMAGWEEAHDSGEAELYLCECANPACRERISLEREDYERVRADSVHFVIVPGHEVADTEVVTEEHEGWAIVEKEPGVLEVTQATDPRRPA